MQQLMLKGDSGEESSDVLYAELQETLIPVNVLHHVIDTINRVKVAGEVYRVTMFGTLVYKPEYESEYEHLLETFPGTLFEYTEKIDSVTYMYNNIKFIDTYSHLQKGVFDPDFILSDVSDDDEEEKVLTKGGPNDCDLADPVLTGRYGIIDSYRVSGSFWSRNYRTRKLDENTRLRVRLFDFKMGIYYSSGMSVKYQRKIEVSKTIRYWFWGWKTKTFTLWHYWRRTNAPEMVVGIDIAKGYIRYEDYGLTSGTGAYYQMDGLNGFARAFSGGVVEGVKKGLNDPIRNVIGWASRGYLFNMNLKLNLPLTEEVNLVEKAARNGIKAGLNAIRGGINSELHNMGKPSQIYIMEGNQYPNREAWAIMGVQRYVYEDYRYVQFAHRAYGLDVNRLILEDACVFGAVKHNGFWRGIRLYLK